MRIAMTSNVFPVSKNMAYGGERILLYLVEELVKKGHEVYCFMREGSNFDGINIKGFTPVPALQDKVDVHYEAIKRCGEKFDVIQINYFGNGYDENIKDYAKVVCELTWCRWAHCNPWGWQRAKNIISYSKVLQSDFTDVGVETTMIHYGLPKDLYKFQPETDNYVVWIGKIEGGKRPDLAIQLAKAAGMKIVLMGPPYNTGTFWKMVGPYIDNDNVFWVRGVDDAQKYKIMSRAKAFISSNGNDWKEHFGIVNAEALAMGVPIIAFNRIGQECAIKVDSIIEEGQQGFFLNYNDADNTQEILEKGVPLLDKIESIDRGACREQFEKKFTADLMARRYDWLYKHIWDNGPVSKVEVPF